MNFDFVCPHSKESAKVDLNVELDFGNTEIGLVAIANNVDHSHVRAKQPRLPLLLRRRPPDPECL